MQDWSMLPEGILDKISDCLDARIDIVRFRSVCSSWRSAVPASRRLLPVLFPINHADYEQGFRLRKATVYLLTTVPHHPRGQVYPDGGSSWLIKVWERAPNEMNLMDPLSRTDFGSLPEGFPKVLDTSRFRISELATEFGMPRMDYFSQEKVVFMCLNCSEFAALTIRISGNLALYKSGDKRWTIISDMPSPYDDVLLLKGKFCAVDRQGRTVTVGLDSKLTEVAGPFHGGYRKFLVESCGELLLADMFLPDDFNSPGGKRIVKFDVYKLDSKKKKWVELKDLGDRVLFLGGDCTFSVPVSDLIPRMRNCIFVTAHVNFRTGDVYPTYDGLHIGVFDISTGRIGPLRSFTGFSELFWPPPKWLLPPTLPLSC